MPHDRKDGGKACNTAVLQNGGAFSELSNCVTNGLCFPLAAEWSETFLPSNSGCFSPSPLSFTPLTIETSLKLELFRLTSGFLTPTGLYNLNPTHISVLLRYIGAFIVLLWSPPPLQNQKKKPFLLLRGGTVGDSFSPCMPLLTSAGLRITEDEIT